MCIALPGIHTMFREVDNSKLQELLFIPFLRVYYRIMQCYGLEARHMQPDTDTSKNKTIVA
eukprot:510234-Pelagomonas_calceolata.AAC.2